MCKVGSDETEKLELITNKGWPSTSHLSYGYRVLHLSVTELYWDISLHTYNSYSGISHTSDAWGNSGYPLRYWGISTPAPLRAFLTGNITAWNRNSRVTMCYRVVRLAECIINSTLPFMKDIYTRRCKARRIIKDPNHPDKGLFSQVWSRRRHQIYQASTERLRKSFYPQATTILNEDTA